MKQESVQQGAKNRRPWIARWHDEKMKREQANGEARDGGRDSKRIRGQGEVAWQNRESMLEMGAVDEAFYLGDTNGDLRVRRTKVAVNGGSNEGWMDW